VSYEAHNSLRMQNVAKRYVHARISIVVSTLRECVHFVKIFLLFFSGFFFLLFFFFLVAPFFFVCLFIFVFGLCGEVPFFIFCREYRVYVSFFLSSFRCFNVFYGSLEGGCFFIS
jgi:hypothetical protein